MKKEGIIGPSVVSIEESISSVGPSLCLRTIMLVVLIVIVAQQRIFVSCIVETYFLVFLVFFESVFICCTKGEILLVGGDVTL